MLILSGFNMPVIMECCIVQFALAHYPDDGEIVMYGNYGQVSKAHALVSFFHGVFCMNALASTPHYA